MEKYNNKYRIPSSRAKWWNYGWNGAYFITICTKIKEHYFGEITGGKMELSQTGVIADVLWHEIPNHSQNVELGDFVVMPNHIHGILMLENPSLRDIEKTLRDQDQTLRDQDQTLQNMEQTLQDQDQTLHNMDQTLHATSLPPKNQRMSAISPKSNTISTIIRSYKSAVTKHANRLGFANGWQPLFHDHIIKNDAEYQRISDYILNNPVNWKDDKFY